MKKLIIDVDVGTDDYLALLYLINLEKSGEVKILGVVCTSGNTILDHVVTHVVRLLESVNRTDIPVFKGSKNHILLHKCEEIRYHGEDGFGDLKYDRQPDLSIVNSTPASIAINDLVSANPHEVSLVCLGPLTSLALAIKLYDDLVDKIKDVWLMGGNYTGIGNSTCAAEFNFHTDPEAAYIVLETLKCPTYIYPWEACLMPQISLEWRFETLGSSTPALELLTRAEKVVSEVHNHEYYIPCDAFLAFCFVKPELHITKSSRHHASVELHGELTRGQVVLDHLKIKEPNIVMIENLDRELFMEELLKLRK